jgi:hypothetical protein
VPESNPYLNLSSLPSRFRRKRFGNVLRLIEQNISQKGRCHILDLGGTDYYWKLHKDLVENFGNKLHIYLVNTEENAEVSHLGPQFTPIMGDINVAETYSLVDYDIIHSNSVIEHIGAWPVIKQHARWILETRKPFYLQTPSYWFPLEPHFRFLGWQWLPESWRAAMLRSKSRGFFPKAQNYEEAMMHVESIKLLTSSQLRLLFPEARIAREWLGPFVKSYMVIFDPMEPKPILSEKA